MIKLKYDREIVLIAVKLYEKINIHILWDARSVIWIVLTSYYIYFSVLGQTLHLPTFTVPNVMPS